MACSGGGGAPRIVVLAATNRPNAVDPALRRPGRFDREIEIGIPDQTNRHDILRKMLARIPNSITDAQYKEVAAKAHGFVGADLKAGNAVGLLCQGLLLLSGTTI